ncbi:MAG: hypothetical protein ACP5LD_15975 [Desulfomonilaceae bacterium]
MRFIAAVAIVVLCVGMAYSQVITVKGTGVLFSDLGTMFDCFAQLQMGNTAPIYSAAAQKKAIMVKTGTKLNIIGINGKVIYCAVEGKSGAWVTIPELWSDD